MKILTMVLFTAACSASTDSGPGGDDGPGGPGVGNDDIRFRLTEVHDERVDQIAFDTGEPVHAHTGPVAQLGGADCPDVYKHLYLMDATAPQFGRETEPNPLAWDVDARGPAEYRVRGAGEAPVLDWTPVDGDRIELHRDVVSAGKYLLDVRVGDSVATTCFMFHPLAAPLEISSPAADATSLTAMTFAAAAPFSRLFADEPIRVFSQTIVHHAAEPVELAIDVTKPIASYQRRAIDQYVVAPAITHATLCEDANGNSSSDPVCVDMSVPSAASDEVVASALATGTWSLQVIDEATQLPAPNCTITGLQARCKLAPRAATGAAQRYRAVFSVANLADLSPFGAGPVAEHTLLGLPFTGRVLDVQKRCAEFKSVTHQGGSILSCIKETHYTRIQAMDTLAVAFEPTRFTLTAAAAADLPATRIEMMNVPAFTWNAGDADLPGPE